MGATTSPAAGSIRTGGRRTVATDMPQATAAPVPRAGHRGQPDYRGPDQERRGGTGVCGPHPRRGTSLRRRGRFTVLRACHQRGTAQRFGPAGRDGHRGRAQSRRIGPGRGRGQRLVRSTPVVKAEVFEPDGHGLFLVEQLAENWGYTRDESAPRSGSGSSADTGLGRRVPGSPAALPRRVLARPPGGGQPVRVLRARGPSAPPSTPVRGPATPGRRWTAAPAAAGTGGSGCPRSRTPRATRRSRNRR